MIYVYNYIYIYIHVYIQKVPKGYYTLRHSPFDHLDTSWVKIIFFPNDVNFSCGQKMTYCILIPKKIEVGKSPPKCCKDSLFAFLWGFLFQSLWTKVTKGPISHHPIPIIFPSAPWALGCSCPCQCNRPTVNVQIGCPARELSLWCSLYGDFDLPAAAIPRKSPAISRSHPDQHVFLEETCRNV